MITRNGIYYDLTLSHYKYEVNGLTFYFSSQRYLKNFKQKLEENRDVINYSLTKRFGIDICVNTLADIVLYKKIEKRGFRIVTGKGVELCQENIICGGATVTTKNCGQQ